VNQGNAKFLSAVIITKNEEQNISKCLDSLKNVADDVLILDSYSTDRTPDICLSFGARVIPVEWKGYAATKNEGNALAQHDWILSIDADEVISTELAASIQTWKSSGSNAFGEFSRLTNYCGAWIRHGGWYPDVKLRIFNRNQARWTGDYVHETLQTDTGVKIERLKGDLLHYSFHTISQHSAQVNRYSTLAAQEKLASGKKPSLLKLLFSPGWSFIQMYLLKLGFLDGRAGFIIAVISAHARFLRYAKMWYGE
jgi:glycosyltransferase involved in cell wall biosynthesis